MRKIYQLKKKRKEKKIGFENGQQILNFAIITSSFYGQNKTKELAALDKECNTTNAEPT